MEKKYRTWLRTLMRYEKSLGQVIKNPMILTQEKVCPEFIQQLVELVSLKKKVFKIVKLKQNRRGSSCVAIKFKKCFSARE